MSYKFKGTQGKWYIKRNDNFSSGVFSKIIEQKFKESYPEHTLDGEIIKCWKVGQENKEHIYNSLLASKSPEMFNQLVELLPYLEDKKNESEVAEALFFKAKNILNEITIAN